MHRHHALGLLATSVSIVIEISMGSWIIASFEGINHWHASGMNNG